MAGLDRTAWSVEDRQLAAKLESSLWREEADVPERMRKLVEPLAAAYFLIAKRAGGRPVDPVAGFHLGNGARLERLNWLGDTSEKGMRDSAGLMVNYLYDLDDIERNHEAFANNAEIVAGVGRAEAAEAGGEGQGRRCGREQMSGPSLRADGGATQGPPIAILRKVSTFQRVPGSPWVASLRSQ